MRGVTAGLLASALVCAAFSVSLAGGTTGEQVFKHKGCANCHSVASLGIESKKMMKGADLSDVGTRRDDDFIMKYLTKEIKLDGKKHIKKFRGSKKDFIELRKWLLTLKQKPS